MWTSRSSLVLRACRSLKLLYYILYGDRSSPHSHLSSPWRNRKCKYVYTTIYSDYWNPVIALSTNQNAIIQRGNRLRSTYLCKCNKWSQSNQRKSHAPFDFCWVRKHWESSPWRERYFIVFISELLNHHTASRWRLLDYLLLWPCCLVWMRFNKYRMLPPKQQDG